VVSLSRHAEAAVVEIDRHFAAVYSGHGYLHLLDPLFLVAFQARTPHGLVLSPPFLNRPLMRSP